MFFTSRRDRQVKVQSILRRICDLTSPNLPHLDDCRGETRQNRTIPVLLTPREAKGVLVEKSVIALTRDLSSNGVSVTLPGSFAASEVAIGFWIPGLQDEPWFCLGAARHQVSLGGGFWAIGLEILRSMERSETRELYAMARCLLPVRARDMNSSIEKHYS